MNPMNEGNALKSFSSCPCEKERKVFSLLVK